MGHKDLLIHYQPGARGDFLASVLLGSFVERERNALKGTDYKKIHHIELHSNPHRWDDVKNFNGAKIRIDANNCPDSLVEIEVNHYIKNNVVSVTDINYYDIIYRAIVYHLNIESSIIHQHKELYTHWIDFQSLKNINFLKKLYYEFNGKDIQHSLLGKIENNINNQINIAQDKKIVNLIKMIDFEMKNNYLNKTKYYNYLANLDNIDNYLSTEYYQKD